MATINNAPKFPNPTETFFSGFSHYWNAKGDKCNICPAFHFASALSQASMAIGKNIYLDSPQGKKYANFYQTIIGTTHKAAKSPTREITVEGVDSLTLDDDSEPIDSLVSQFKSVSSLASYEGLKECLATHEVSSNPNEVDTPFEWYEGNNSNGVRLLVHYDEVAALLGGTNTKIGDKIAYGLTELYSMPKRQIIPSRSNPIRADNPFVNFFGCSTFEWFENTMRTVDVHGGFLNRFVFYLYPQMKRKAVFEPIDDKSLSEWRKAIRTVAKVSLELEKPRVFTFSDEVLSDYIEWFDKIENAPKLTETDDLVEAAQARVVEFAQKLALVFSVFNLDQDIEHNKVEMGAWQAARAIAEYWRDCVAVVFSSVDANEYAKLENRIIAKLIDLGGSATRTELMRKVGNKYFDSGTFSRCLYALQDNGLVHILKGRPERIYHTPNGMLPNGVLENSV